MPGWELINNKEKSALNNLFRKNKGILFATVLIKSETNIMLENLKN